MLEAELWSPEHDEPDPDRASDDVAAPPVESASESPGAHAADGAEDSPPSARIYRLLQAEP